MQVVSYAEARNSLKAVLGSVVDNADCTIIMRKCFSDSQPLTKNFWHHLG